jgi:hypothetical protein
VLRSSFVIKGRRRDAAVFSLLRAEADFEDGAQ